MKEKKNDNRIEMWVSKFKLAIRLESLTSKISLTMFINNSI